MATLSGSPEGPIPGGPTMKLKIRHSASKHKKKTGFRTRQQTRGGRKVNTRQRRRAAGRGKSRTS